MKIRIGKHRTLNLVKFFGFIVEVAMILFLLWFVVSYIDVIWFQNKGGTPHQWNFWIQLIKNYGSQV